MSRPKDLPVALQSWAPGNYTAGPSWGGTPQRAAPGAAFLTPGVTLPAEVENYLHGNAFDAAQGLINFVGQLPVNNLRGSLQTYCLGSAFDPRFQVLWTVATNGSTTMKLLYVAQPGSAPVDVISGVTTAGDTDNDSGEIDVNGTAVVCAVAGGRYGYLYDPIANTPSRVDVGGTGIAAMKTMVYEPVTGRWVSVGYASASVPTARYSTNGTAWSTGGTLAGAIGSNGFRLRSTTNKTGTIIVSRPGGTNNTVGIAKSTDGGTTWSWALSAITTSGITNVWTCDLSYSSDTGLYYAVLVGSGGTSKSEIWTSPDGTTWTLKKAFTTSGINSRIVTLGSLLVSSAGVGFTFITGGAFYPAYSVDGGTTWKLAGQMVGLGNSARAFLCDGQVAFVTMNDGSAIGGIFLSTRVGVPSTTVLT